MLKMSKTVRNIREPLKKPRPLRSSSIEQPKEESLNPRARADVLADLEILNVRISNCDSKEVAADISQMCTLLKKHGEELESGHKDAIDRYLSTLRNSSRADHVEDLTRVWLLEVIEMRAMHWKMNENFINYFSSKCSKVEEAGGDHQNMSGSISPSVTMIQPNQSMMNMSGLTLAPGEYLRSSGKFPKPTKISGKNYFKDEIVIRNCDSGKVMGIKGRRVHMIEELSDTVISFQRVNAGARDRLVQITGPNEESIGNAKYLLEDTIKRNVSPIRDNHNLSELDNRDHFDLGNSFFDQSSTKNNLSHSLSMNDASTRECPRVSVNIGQDVIMLSGYKLDLLKTAQNVLVEYFSSQAFDKNSPLLPLSKSVSSENANQRFTLQKKASLKDNLASSFSSTELGNSRRSSSSSWSSDELLPDKERSDQETTAILPPTDIPIPPPSYPSQPSYTYSRRFLLECAKLPLSQKIPPNYEHFTSGTPDIKPLSPVRFDPLLYLQEHPQ